MTPGVLTDLLRRQPLSPGKVEFVWRLAVGPQLARVTRVRLAADGRLEVRVADARWQAILQRSSRLILGRLESSLGPDVVKRIVVS
jgi:predicted nucleic acid-binding Zn ribbon protein